MSALLEDVRFALRLLLKSRGFTLVSVLTLALAIGANTALFSVVNGVLLRPLPFPEPDRLMQVVRVNKDHGRSASQSIPAYTWMTAEGSPFSRVSAHEQLLSGFSVVGDGLPERLSGARVTGSFFETFGARPTLGRDFLPEEDVVGGPRVVILSEGLWQRRFGGAPDVVGRSIVLNDEPYTVVGVAPATFAHPRGALLWTPLQLDLTDRADVNYLFVTGRLRPGITLDGATAMLRTLGGRVRTESPGLLDEGQEYVPVELRTYLAGDLRLALWVLLGAVGLVLLIACVNLANLQLARAASRNREWVVRAALGAAPGRLARQMLTESLLLSVLGGGLGVLLAAAALPGLLALAPDTSPLLSQDSSQVGIDGAVMGFTLAASLLTGLLFGLLPAWQASRTDLETALRQGAQRTTLGPTGGRTRALLVVGQVALAVMLLVGAALLIRGFFALQNVQPGFDPHGVHVLRMSLPEARYGTPQTLERFEAQVEERVRALPGVEGVGFTAALPMGAGPSMSFSIEGKYTGDDNGPGAGWGQYRPVNPGYFEALRIGLVRGRLLTASDVAGSEPVVVINETAARRFWQGEDPMGQRIRVAHSVPGLRDEVPRVVVGVVRDVREDGLNDEPPPVMYLAPGQMSQGIAALLVRMIPRNLLVRAPGGHAEIIAAVQREVWAVDPQQPVMETLKLADHVARSLGSERFNMVLLAMMAALALLLAAVGIYGVLSYLVSQRTREMGVRLALGATRGEVVRLVLRQGMGSVAGGVVLGCAGALALTRLVSGFVHGVSALDPLSFIAAPLVLLTVGLVATWLPALRASRVDPIIALKYD
ncbi:ABC transporter permease [Myxococcus sp. K38C18041901]|uniref:ABC transporter permease n=1 Tax=Myxococcus guangdongensis TaxID=2906760 RepID=UPI0020A74B6F|nr:ADOP family duplicated permease [Myxococcus guangdongensis]MCP3061100.1 ABC transporter permease [Myxococcus guangdongensis]